MQPGTSRQGAVEMFRASVPRYEGRPGLVRKYYLFGEGYGGGVYLWESRAAAEALFTPEWQTAIAERFGEPPEIAYYESPIIIDNAAQQVTVAAA
jgi:hypothetical protein